MEKKGVQTVHVSSIDNSLVKPAGMCLPLPRYSEYVTADPIRRLRCRCIVTPDPLFVGFFEAKGGECGAKVISKAAPTEAVGVFAVNEGRVRVVEYSELSSDVAHAVGSDGKLLLNAANICNHIYTVDFLRFAAGAIIPWVLFAMPCVKTVFHSTCNCLHRYHVAKKKIPTLDSDGEAVKPSEPNGIKLETFIFDVFGYVSTRTSVWLLATVVQQKWCTE